MSADNNILAYRRRYLISIAISIAIILNADVCLAAVHKSFFVVHCEALPPRSIKISLNKGLIPLVRMADKYGIKLTIALSPQWAQYFLANPETLLEIRNWTQNGHEIGILHYGLNHKPTWDHYTNETDPRKIIDAGHDPKEKKGTMNDLVNVINSLLQASGVGSKPARQISISFMDWERDLLPGLHVKYVTDGNRIKADFSSQDVVGKPATVIINNYPYTKLGMGYFTAMQSASPTVDHMSYGISTVYNFLKNSLTEEGITGDKCDLSCFKLSLRYFLTLRPANCESSRLLNNLFTLYSYLKTSPLTRDNGDFTFGLVTHPLDFIADNPVNGGCGKFENWFKFVYEKVERCEITSNTVSQVFDR